MLGLQSLLFPIDMGARQGERRYLIRPRWGGRRDGDSLNAPLESQWTALSRVAMIANRDSEST